MACENTRIEEQGMVDTGRAQLRVFCESVPRQILLLGLLVFPGAARGTRVLQFDKKLGAYHTSLKPPVINKEPDSNAKMDANHMG